MGDLDDFYYNSPIRVVPTGIVEGLPVLSEVFYFAGTSLYQFVNYLPLTPSAEVPEDETFMISGYEVPMRSGVAMKMLECLGMAGRDVLPQPAQGGADGPLLKIPQHYQS